MRAFVHFDPATGAIEQTATADVPCDHNGLACAEFTNVSLLEARRGKYRVDRASFVVAEGADCAHVNLIAES